MQIAVNTIEKLSEVEQMKDEEKHKSAKWIPWYFVAFFVGLAILDGIFVYIATSTHRGVVTDNAYQKGLDYNAVVQASKEQKKLGWRGNIVFKQPSLFFTLDDAQGNRMDNGKVMAYISRVTQAGYDFSVPLYDNGNGIYTNDITFPMKGQWNVEIGAEWNQQPYQQNTRILVK